MKHSLWNIYACLSSTLYLLVKVCCQSSDIVLPSTMKMVYPSVSSCPDNYRPLPYECAPCGCAKKAICSKELSYHCPKGGRCKRGRYGQGCVFGIISLSNDQANPYEPTNVTCIIRTADPNSDTGNIFLNIDGYLSPEYKPIEVTPSEVNPGNLKAVFYLTYGLNVGERYTCSVGDEEGQVVSRSATALLYELPVLTRTLDLHPMAHEGSYLSLLVNRWDPSVGDTGDGPVIGYIIKRCLHTETENCSSVNYPSYHYLVEVLDYNRTDNFSIPVNTYFTPTPGSTYSFIYKARRPGLWGIGPASNPLTTKIPCQKPVAAPLTHDNYTMNLMNSSKKVEVSISWELPTSVDHYHRCNNVTSFTVQLMQEDGSIYSTTSVTYDITSLSTLVEPYSLYTVLLSYTNNEGYESDRHRLVLERTPPASPDACRVAGVYMVSKNSARVYWDKPQYPHGQITTYQVFFKRPKFLAFEEACKVQSTRGHCTISKLRMDTNYDIMVRAENEAGYGDNSSVWRFTTYLGEPGPVENFQNISKTESYIEFSWLPPKSNGGYPVKNFKLTILADNGNSEQIYKIPQELNKYNATSLAHSTRYICRLTSCNSEGCSKDIVELVVFTDPIDPPLPTIPKFIEEKNTDTSIALEISSAKGCSLYRVVVMEITSISKRSIDTQTSTQTKVEDCQKCCEGSCYIAGELNVEELPMTFIVGNNKSYNNYFNPPLVTGKQYQIWYGAGNTVDGVEKFSFVSLDQPVVAREHVQEKSPIMASSTLIGIIVAVCACAVVMIVLVMLLVRHKRNKKFRFRTPDSEKVLELNENGTLLPNGTYQRGDAVSVDSLDMSKQPNGEPVYDNVRLKNYPVMVEELRQYIELKSSDEGFKKEYNRIPWGLKFSHDVAKLPDNKHKNRYGNIIAYDHSRVILRGKHPEQDTDYINASYIDGYKTPREYIATQGPTKFTVNDLWHMAWQENTTIIVMVTNTIEQTRHKCERYWPEQEGVQYGNVKVTLSSTKSLAHYKIRTFTMEQDDEVRHIKQFHFTAWPDHGTPTHATTLLSFLKRVRQHKTPSDGPIICHCSAGVGRSGTFIALDSLIQQAESEGKVDVYGYVSQMRKQRCNMIQTLDQYIFLHDAILEASEGFDTTISLAEFKSEYDIIKQDQLTGKGQLDALYLKLQDLLYVDRNTDATSKDNLAKNRCANIIPFNERRVMLINMPSDYINATYVDDHRKRSALIATQHPLSSTVEDFWKMVQTQKPFAVVTLCGASAVDECNDKKSLPKFWPTPECRTKEFTTVSVELLEEAELEKISSVVMQKLTVHCKNQAMYQSKPADVDHYICNFWPSQKTLPTDTESFVKLVAMIERRKQENDDRQIVINCYDGAKQSGLYITCHALLQQILIDGEVDIPETVKLIRNDQPMFIPHVDQFKFCYEFVSRYVDSSTQDSAVFTCL